jgi:hypothetical protein
MPDQVSPEAEAAALGGAKLLKVFKTYKTLTVKRVGLSSPALRPSVRLPGKLARRRLAGVSEPRLN